MSNPLCANVCPYFLCKEVILKLMVWGPLAKEEGGAFILGHCFRSFFRFWLIGFLAFFGFLASWLLGFLLVYAAFGGFLVYSAFGGFGFSHPSGFLAFAPFHWFLDLASRIISITTTIFESSLLRTSWGGNPPPQPTRYCLDCLHPN